MNVRTVDDFTCPYCLTDLSKKVFKTERHGTCDVCYHEFKITTSKLGFKVYNKTKQVEASRMYRIDRGMYRDVIYTITDAEILKINFMEFKISFEDFFDVCNQEQYKFTRDTIVYKSYILGIPSYDIHKFFKENGSKLNQGTIIKIIDNYEHNTKTQRIRSNLQRISS